MNLFRNLMVALLAGVLALGGLISSVNNKDGDGSQWQLSNSAGDQVEPSGSGGYAEPNG